MGVDGELVQRRVVHDVHALQADLVRPVLQADHHQCLAEMVERSGHELDGLAGVIYRLAASLGLLVGLAPGFLFGLAARFLYAIFDDQLMDLGHIGTVAYLHQRAQRWRLGTQAIRRY